MDLETFFTTVYVLVDDWYKEQIADLKPKVGAPAQMSDSEVLTLAVVGQWRVSVPWQSERGLVRYIQAHGRGMFPRMLKVSAFNQRVRYLSGVLVGLQQAIASWLGYQGELYECVDSLPLPAGQLGNTARKRALVGNRGLGKDRGVGFGGIAGWSVRHQGASLPAG
jgi:hypothetical protein